MYRAHSCSYTHGTFSQESSKYTGWVKGLSPPQRLLINCSLDNFGQFAELIGIGRLDKNNTVINSENCPKMSKLRTINNICQGVSERSKVALTILMAYSLNLF
jgi:hypothetical protein